MKFMSCDEIEDMLGAHALDELPDDAAVRVEAHLGGCPEHAETLAGLKRTASLLALTVEERRPPAELRQRVMEAIRSGATLPEPAARVAVRPPGPERVRRWLPRRVHIAIAAALAAVILAAVGGYQLAQVRALSQEWTFSGGPQAPTAVAHLVFLKGRQQTVLTVTGLRELSGRQVYELWLIRDGDPVPQGISTAPGGKLGALIQGDLTRYDTFAITVEPGEQPKPTTEPILAAPLRAGRP